MARICENHAEVAAVAECTQCRKSLCTSCTMVTPAGRFCSSECSIVHRELKVRAVEAGKRKKTGGLIVVLVLMMPVAAAFMVHFAARGKKDEPDHWLKKIDVIGRILDKESR